jgi:DUF4097 and DUF4098 domain-containing protein YvlB
MRALALALAALIAFAPPAHAALDHQIIGGEQDHSLPATGDCDHFYKTTFTSFESQVHDQEQRELGLEDIERIHVTTTQEGGLSIRGWNRSSARLIVCRYAVANSRQHALRVLGSICVASRNGEIAAYGPEIDATQAWWVNMILYVPRHANVDIDAANGGVAIRSMNGRVTAHSTTGGISVAQSTGRYKLTTVSGGITLDRVSGFVDAASKDGGIALKIAGDAPTIEARTADAGHILCTLKGCEEKIGTWAANRTQLRIGEGVPDIRLATNGASILIAPVPY